MAMDVGMCDRSSAASSALFQDCLLRVRSEEKEKRAVAQYVK